MTKQDFIAGKKFEYTGHFQLLATEPSLHFSDGFLIDRYDLKFAFVMAEPTDQHFVAWKANYGSVTIHFTECKLKTDDHA